MYTDGFAKVNNTNLYYEMTGEGEVIVLIHSGLTDLRQWDEQFDLFGKYFRVIRYDIRGFGKSDRPSESFSYIEDLRSLFDYHRIKKAHLIGVSMGGSIAIDFTIQYPQLVESLILSGSSLNGYKFTVDEQTKIRSLAVMSIVKRDKDFNKSIEFMLDDPMWKQSNPKSRQCLKNMFLDTSLEWIFEGLEKTFNPPASERLSEISKKTLLIIGSEDSEPIKEIAGVLESNIATIKKVEIKDTGHLPNLDKPDEFNKIVLEFLGSYKEEN